MWGKKLEGVVNSVEIVCDYEGQKHFDESIPYTCNLAAVGCWDAARAGIKGCGLGWQRAGGCGGKAHQTQGVDKLSDDLDSSSHAAASLRLILTCLSWTLGSACHSFTLYIQPRPKSRQFFLPNTAQYVYHSSPPPPSSALFLTSNTVITSSLVESRAN